jgi:hypothetical protein
MLPSDTSLWSSGYRNLTTTNTWSYCPESDAQTQAKITAGTLTTVNDWLYDEIFWDHNTGIGKPASRHTYQSGVYVPSLDMYMMICRRLWKISLSSDAPVYKRQINDTTGAAKDGEHGITIYDEVTNEFLSSAGGSAAIYNRVSYNLNSDSWTFNPSNFAPPWAGSAVASAIHVRAGRTIHAVYPGDSRNPDRYWIYNLDSRTTTTFGSSGFTYSGISGKSYWMDDNDAGSIVYLPNINKYWLWWKSAASGMQCVEIDPTTTPWTMSPKTFTGNIPSHRGQTINCAIYVADQQAVWFHTKGTDGWYVYKF